jgi:hypothetical protein
MDDWKPILYSRFLDLTIRWHGTLILVIRGQLLDEGNQFLQLLKPFLINVNHSSTWPGTRLLSGETAEIYKIAVHRESINIIRSASISIWDWLGPRYPEDLSFLRHTGKPWFVSITHEHDAFFKLFPSEHKFVEANLGVSLVFQCIDQCQDEIY